MKINFPVSLNNIEIYEDLFKYESEINYHKDIIGLYYKKQSFKMNFVQMSNTIDFYIKTYGGTIYGAKHSIKKKQNCTELFDFAFAYLNHITYKKRLSYYLSQLKSNGFISYDYTTECGLSSYVQIFREGYIKHKNKNYDLKKAKREGILKFGGEWSYGANSSYNPYRVIISEKKSIFGLNIGFLYLYTEWDTEIVQSIINHLAEHGSI